jgi:penicillin-insensitive murein endopeptidase
MTCAARRTIVLASAAAMLATAAAAQDKPASNTKLSPNAPAKVLFGAKAKPADMAARSIGYYNRGCLAGGVALPPDGPTWQVIRLSRNRNWGHPVLIRVLERLAKKAPSLGWRGLLVGDLTQPRGGPMLTGHASHQVGLDADVWLTPMPDRVMSRREREDISAINIVAASRVDINPKVWTPAHHAIIKAAATMPEVERVFVNPAIKRALCREAKGDRSWLSTVRAYWGHNYHMHIRISCPKGDPCRSQTPPPNDDGCGKELAWWLKKVAVPPRPPKVPPKPRPPIRLAELPDACRTVLTAPAQRN